MDIIEEIELISVNIDGGMEYKPTVMFMHRKDYRRYKWRRFFKRIRKLIS